MDGVLSVAAQLLQGRVARSMRPWAVLSGSLAISLAIYFGFLGSAWVEAVAIWTASWTSSSLNFLGASTWTNTTILASDGFAVKGEAYGVPGVVVDGNDLLAVRQVTAEAVARARRGDGPTLIEAKTFRMGGHSTSDDPTRYVPEELITEWAKKDPVLRFEAYLATRGLWEEGDRESLYEECMGEVKEAADEAQATSAPSLETIFSDVYEEVPPHIRSQGEAAFDLLRRKGDAAAGDGAFPL